MTDLKGALSAVSRNVINNMKKISQLCSKTAPPALPNH